LHKFTCLPRNFPTQKYADSSSQLQPKNGLKSLQKHDWKLYFKTAWIMSGIFY
jgi:hypothetical protein